MIWISDAELSARVGAGTARVGADIKRKDKSTGSLTNDLVIRVPHHFTGPPVGADGYSPRMPCTTLFPRSKGKTALWLLPIRSDSDTFDPVLHGRRYFTGRHAEAR